MKDAGPEIANKIMEKVEDPSMKAYLDLELRLRGLKKQINKAEYLYAILTDSQEYK